MDLQTYIKVYDNCFPVEAIGSILKWVNDKKFNLGGIGPDNTIDKKIRDVEIFPLLDCTDNSQTKIHWYNFLAYIVWQTAARYKHELNLDLELVYISDISILKYNSGGHYKKHVDHMPKNPRTISFILLLNNDYEGGTLKFYDSFGKLIKEIDTQPGRVIIWPSNFLFPHGIDEIKKGTRYSIVSWIA
jgi:Rps23 Pro-64 3,4-dihydroxylase Tpa1-like proline 4-hydroxylase